MVITSFVVISNVEIKIADYIYSFIYLNHIKTKYTTLYGNIYMEGGGGGGGARGWSCHKSQIFRITNHNYSQTFQMLQSESQRMAQRILKSQVADKSICKFTDHRFFLFGHHRSQTIPLSQVIDLFSAFSQITDFKK